MKDIFENIPEWVCNLLCGIIGLGLFALGIYIIILQ